MDSDKIPPPKNKKPRTTSSSNSNPNTTMGSNSNYYDLLGVSKQAKQDEIKKAYR